MTATRSFFEYPLVRCSKDPFPRLRAPTDLSQNLDVLRLVLERTKTFFDFDEAWPLFCGFARPALPEDGSQPLFYVQLWEEGQVVRSWAFRGLGFVGILHVSYRDDYDGHIFFQDYIEAVYFGVSQERTLPYLAEEKALALIDRDKLLVPIVWRP